MCRTIEVKITITPQNSSDSNWNCAYFVDRAFLIEKPLDAEHVVALINDAIRAAKLGIDV